MNRSESIQRIDKKGGCLSSDMDSVAFAIGEDIFTYGDLHEIEFIHYRAARQLGRIAKRLHASSVAELAERMDYETLRDTPGVGYYTFVAWLCALEMTGRNSDLWIKSKERIQTIMHKKKQYRVRRKIARRRAGFKN